MLSLPIADLAKEISNRRRLIDRGEPVQPFVLFLGAGCARAADVPEVWEVARDCFESQFTSNPEATAEIIPPEHWHIIRQDPETHQSQLVNGFYSLLSNKSPVERYSLLERFYVGLPIPRFYQDIARLTRNGYFGHFLTTNVDRLLEEALEGAGLYAGRDYAVYGLGSLDRRSRELDDDRAHAPPIAVVKLHGDISSSHVAISPQEIQEMLRPQRQFVKAELSRDVIMAGYEGESQPVNTWMQWTSGALWWVNPEQNDPSKIVSLDNRPVHVIDGPSAHPVRFFGTLLALIENPRPSADRDYAQQSFAPTGQALHVSDEDRLEAEILQQQLSTSETMIRRLQHQARDVKSKDRVQLEYERHEAARLEDELRALIPPQKIVLALSSVRDAAQESSQDPALVTYLEAQIATVEAEHQKPKPNQTLIGAAASAVAAVADRLPDVDPQMINVLRTIMPTVAKG